MYEVLVHGEYPPDTRHLTARPHWMRDALCAERPGVDFFVDRGGSTAPAKAVCAQCLVREECLSYAIENDISYGVWGGTSRRERKLLGRSAA